MIGRLSVTAATLVCLIFAQEGYAQSREVAYLQRGKSMHTAIETCSETDRRERQVVFQKNGNRVSIPGAVTVGLDDWEAVYIPIDVETNWYKSTRSTHKPVLLQMTATSSTYLPFSDNGEFIRLMEDTHARRDFLYGLEQANGREVEAVKTVNHDGRDYIGTRFKSDSGGKILFSLGSIAKNGLMVAFTFCFDRADDKAVTDLEGGSIITSFLENVRFGPQFKFQF
jgi:hypothetical protein